MDKRTTKNGKLRNEWDLTGKLNRVTTPKNNWVFITEYEYYRITPNTEKVYGKIIKNPYLYCVLPMNIKALVKESNIPIWQICQAVGISMFDLRKLMWLKTDVAVEVLNTMYEYLKQNAPYETPRVKLLNKEAMKDLMFEYDLRDKTISDKTGVPVDTIKKIKAGDMTVSFDDWYSVSCFVSDFYEVNNR
tara:strand:+ start:2001 stop:2570 length:570 start_codon:yes stop_codon:yes gene_type:complete